jgi:hypothetical protein
VVPSAICRYSFPPVLDAADSEGRIYSPQHHYQQVCQKAGQDSRLLGSVFQQRLTVAADHDCYNATTISQISHFGKELAR